MWKDIVTIINVDENVSDTGNIAKLKTERTVFCNIKSVKQREFYQAQAVGLKPEIELEMWALDYENEELFKIENVEYRVLRTYKKGNIIELILTKNNRG